MGVLERWQRRMRGTPTQSPPRRERAVVDADPVVDAEYAHARAELLATVSRRSAVSSSLWRYLSTAVHCPVPPGSASGRLECSLASPLHATSLSSAAGPDAEPASREAALVLSNARVTAWLQQCQSLW